MWRLSAIAMLLLAATLISADKKTQYVTMVWDAGCIDEVFKTQDTKLEAPVDENGQPDMKRAVIRGLGIRFANNNCGRYVVHNK